MNNDQPCNRGHNGGAATKRAADARAMALATVIRELRAAGFTKLSAIAAQTPGQNLNAPRLVDEIDGARLEREVFVPKDLDASGRGDWSRTSQGCRPA